MAELAERGVRAVGVDPSERMAAVARGRWPEADFLLAGACELPLADSSADGYRADKVFHELPSRNGCWRRPAGCSCPEGGSCRSARTGTPSSSTPTT
ncbi:hypothetical protein GCM10010129_38870 [Streptomyces fumigatiscleroticus]|nr:hypothetical protein GCM10010129_38870 [Streptomyces fumigatiscleroticus]